MFDERCIIDRLQVGVVDENAFAEIPELLARHLGADSGWLLSNITPDPTIAPSLGGSYGFDDDISRAYFGGGFQGDPWLAAAPQVPVGRGFAFERVVSSADFIASPVYNDLLRGRSEILHCMALAVSAEGRLHAMAFQRSRQSSSFMEEGEEKLSALAKPLAQIIATRRRRILGLARHIDDPTLEAARDAVIVCDRAEIMHYRNPAAEWQLTLGFPLQRSSGQRVSGCGDEALPLAKAITNAATRGLASRLNIDGGPQGRFIIRVEADAGASGLAVIVVRNTDAYTAHLIEETSLAYGFTPAEAALARSLVHGLSIEDHADRRGLRVSTVRTQLRALLAKTGTTRQGQLISLLLSDPPFFSYR